MDLKKEEKLFGEAVKEERREKLFLEGLVGVKYFLFFVLFNRKIIW